MDGMKSEPPRTQSTRRKTMKRVCIVGSLSLLLLCDLRVLGGDNDFASKLDALVKAHDGQVAVVVQRFGEPVAYSVNADVPMPTASLIKFPVMVEAYYQFQEGKAKP